MVAENCEFEQSSIPLNKVNEGCLEFVSYNNLSAKVTDEKFEKLLVEDSVKKKLWKIRNFTK